MNTQARRLRKQIVSEILGHLLKGTCEYSPGSLGAHDCIVEPDAEALIELREKIAYMSHLAFKEDWDILKTSINDYIIPWVVSVGNQHGHIAYGRDWTTGTWGHRYTTLCELLAMIDWESPIGTNDILLLYGVYTCKVSWIRPNWYGVHYYIETIGNSKGIRLTEAISADYSTILHRPESVLSEVEILEKG